MRARNGMSRRGRGRANSRPRDHATRWVSTSDLGRMLWFGAWVRRGLRDRQCARRAARAPASSHTAPSPARLRSGARGRLPAAGARRRGRRASAARRHGDRGSACKRGSGSARRACTARWSAWSVESVECVECVECMCSLVLLACCASCSRSADVAVVKLWWMPPTLRGVTGASSRWRMKVGASQGSGSGCLRPCSRRSARVS